jgi:hypothetical protein
VENKKKYLASAELAEQDSRTQQGMKMQNLKQGHCLISTTITHSVCI